MEQFVEMRMMYNPAIVSTPPCVGSRILSSLKEQIEAWAKAEVPKSHFSRNELARKAGISPATIHRIMGLDESYAATPKWQNVSALAKALGVKPPSIPHPDHDDGLAEPEAIAIVPSPSSESIAPSPNQTEWKVKGASLASMGYMPGDHFILDQSVQPQNRDCVVAQVVDYETGTAETVLRVFVDGFLVTPNYIIDGTPRLFVDGKIVHIMGTIIRSWRARSTS
jgi:transcriptional regulator with XRE-family HTH domain